MSLRKEFLLNELNTARSLSDCEKVKHILDGCIHEIQSSIKNEPKSIILEIMVDTTVDSPMSTIDIAKASGLGSTRKSVNKYLYEMQRQGIISKTSEADGTKPHWYIV